MTAHCEAIDNAPGTVEELPEYFDSLSDADFVSKWSAITLSAIIEDATIEASTSAFIVAKTLTAVRKRYERIIRDAGYEARTKPGRKKTLPEIVPRPCEWCGELFRLSEMNDEVSE